MQRNTIIALCGLILVLALGSQWMTSQLGKTVPKVSSEAIQWVVNAANQSMSPREVKVSTPGKMVLVQVKEPVQLPNEAMLQEMAAALSQKPEFNSFQKLEVRYEKDGAKGQLANSIIR